MDKIFPNEVVVYSSVCVSFQLWRMKQKFSLKIFLSSWLHGDTRQDTIWTLCCLILDNDQRDAQLLHFKIYLLHSSTCFEHYMLIIRRLNCIDVAPGIVLSISGRPVHRLGDNCRTVLSQPVHRTVIDWKDDIRCCINTVHSPDDEHIMLETCRGM